MRVFLFLILVSIVSSYKFLVFSPQFANSHVNFMARISDVLVDAGHEVVMLSPIIDKGVRGPGSKKVRLIEIPQNEHGMRVEHFMNANAASNAWKDQSPMIMLLSWGEIMDSYAKQCLSVLQYPGLMEQLRAEKFDVAYVESIDFCGPTLFYLLGIEKVAITDSMAITDNAFSYTQTPSNPSYVPSLMGGNCGEKMTFMERVTNTISFALTDFFNSLFLPIIQDKLNEQWPELPSVTKLLARNSLVFVNSEPLVDFPRPTSARVIDIGGITVSSSHQPLNKTWSDIMDLRPKTVLLSFGTFAKAFAMPEEYKQTIRETVKKFPNVTFIWKYEKPEHKISEGIDNLIESTWVPQRDMLHDPRLSAFITHCGQGSTTESIDAGIPLVVIPVVADQFRNAQQIKRNQIGIIMEKTDLAQVGKLEIAIREILENEKYRIQAKKVQSIIHERPFSMKDIFIRNMEFLAKHGPLDQLNHYGRHLNFFQYYLIDVIAFVSSVVLIVLIVIVLTLKFIVSRALRWIVVKKKVD